MARYGSPHLDSLFRDAAEAVAASLTRGAAAAPTAAGAAARPLLQRLCGVLLATQPDASGAAEAGCRKLRNDVANALLQAVAGCSTAFGRSLAEGTCRGTERPRLWVEVRHTAGRWMPAGAAFTVGTDDGCDIQVVGDSTVSPLQCLIVPLPGGTVVIDAWSSASATRKLSLASRSLPEQEPPPLVGQQKLNAFVLSLGERTILVVGERTTLTLGRPAPERCPTAINSGLAMKEARGEHGSTLALTTASPQLPAAGRGHSAPPCEGLTSLLEELPFDVYPSGVRRTAPEDGQRSVLVQSQHVGARQAPSSHPPGTSSAGGGRSSKARLRWCLAAVRASVRLRLLSMKATLRLRQQRDLQAELRWRCRAALRAGVLLERQCRDLEARLLPSSSRSDAREVLKVLDVLGAPLQPKLPLEARGRKRPRSDLALPSQVFAASTTSVPQEQLQWSMAGTSAVAFMATRHCRRPWSGHLQKCRATMSAAHRHVLVRLRKVATSAFQRFRSWNRRSGYHHSDRGLKAYAAPGHCSMQQCWRPSKTMRHAKLTCSPAVPQPLGLIADQPPAKKGRFS